MSFLELAEKRYSVRSYLDKEVEKEKLLQILEAGRLAPSAVNFQPVHFYVIEKEEDKKKLHEVYPRDWFIQAPVIIVACENHTQAWKRRDGKDHADIDAAIAVDHMVMAATDLGLGTCWICAFDAKRCHEILALPEDMEAAVLLPIGYTGSESPAKKRKSLEEMVSWGL